MAVISSVLGKVGDFDQITEIDHLELTSEERARAHFAAQTVSGKHLRVSLPRGVELQDGDVLSLDGGSAVVVKAKDEDLMLIRPGSEAILWWAACYQLGNLHRPARFREDGILTTNDPMAAQMLRGLGVSVELICGPFTGRRFGAAGAHHAHDHIDTEVDQSSHDHQSGHGQTHSHHH